MAGAIANRYARALVDVTTKPGAPVSPEQFTRELSDFVEALKASDQLRNVLLTPAVPTGKKKALVAALGVRLGVGKIAQNFLNVVIDHRRIPLLGEMLAAFQTLLDERRGIVRADVVAAQPVDDQQQSALAGKLGELTGKQVRLNPSIDPALLGGVVARIGSTIYDGSVRGQLHALGRKLATE